MDRRIGIILLALVGAVCVAWMLNPLVLIVPVWMTVFWLLCPDYNALSAYCGTANAEFILTRIGAAGGAAIVLCLLIWLVVRWWSKP